MNENKKASSVNVVSNRGDTGYQVTCQARGPICLPALAAHLGGHAVGDAEGQMLQDALHAVVVLLSGGAQVLLERPGHGGEDGLGCLSRVHHLPGRFLLFLSLETLDVDKGFFYCHDQSRRKFGTIIKAVPTVGFGDSLLRP